MREQRMTDHVETAKVSLKNRRAAALAQAVIAPVGQHRNPMKELTQVSQRLVPLRFIQPNPDQPRNGVDETSLEFAELRESIRRHGLLQPISLWQLDSDEEAYTIIAGERRWRAYSELALDDPDEFGRIPAVVTHVVGDNREAQVLMKAIIENVVRVDLKEGEKAAALKQLREWTGWSFEAIADRMGMTVNRVLELAAIARHQSVVDAVDTGQITKKQAIAIGQTGVDADLAAAMAEGVGDLDPKVVRQVAKRAKAADPSLPAPERVREARATVLVGTSQGPMRTEIFPLRSADGEVREVAREIVMLNNTALRTVRPRLAEVDRDAFVVMLRQTCEDTNVWVLPQPSQVSIDEYRQVVDGLCRAGDYYPERPPVAE
jgi:ParB family chromosome partitioning protein